MTSALAGDVRFVTCHKLLFNSDWICPSHRHKGCHELILMLHGGIFIGPDKYSRIARAGNVVFYPQNMDHAPRSEGKEDLQAIVVHWSGGENMAHLSMPDVRIDRYGRLKRQMEWLLELYPSQSQIDLKMFDAITYTIVHEFGRLQNPELSDLTTRLRAYVRNHLTDRITLDDLARQARMSKYHFARKFKAVTGQSPMSMVQQMRVRAAEELLRQTDLPLEAIAEHTGFADASHMSHVFRRLMGCTPGSIRRESGNLPGTGGGR